MDAKKSSSIKEGHPGLIQVALMGLCPNCFSKTLFQSWANLTFSCGSCAVKFRTHSFVGRLSVLLTLFIAVLSILLAIILDIWLRPPVLLSLAVFLPMTFFCVVFLLRFYKAWAVKAYLISHISEGDQ